MIMTTRTYHLPKNRIAIHVINHMLTKVGCSIGELKVNQKADTIRVPITCNDADVKKIERILDIYGMMEDK
jgi:hypothetical protein